MYRGIILIIVFIGVLFISIEVARIQTGLTRTEPKIEYRYIPRTFAEEQDNPVYVSEIFETLFSEPSPWVLSVREYDQKKAEKINQYFVSQM
jgi:hypothetical protein